MLEGGIGVLRLDESAERLRQVPTSGLRKAQVVKSHCDEDGKLPLGSDLLRRGQFLDCPLRVPLINPEIPGSCADGPSKPCLRLLRSGGAPA